MMALCSMNCWLFRLLLLLGRAGAAAIGAEHTAIARLGAKGLAAGGTLIHNLAGVKGHCFCLLEGAMGTMNGRNGLRHRLSSLVLTYL
jgi:hypothetical protein